MKPAEFHEQLMSGGTICYFHGNLAGACERVVSNGKGNHANRKTRRFTPDALAAQAIRDAVWKAYEDNKGTPVQRRNGAGFDYLFMVAA